MKKVLVIDDEPPVARLIGAALKAAGVEHSLDYCSDGAQGRAKATEGHYDLITLDLHMPFMGGIEALRKMQQDPKLSETPVVIITGQKDSVYHDRAREFGAMAVVTKPFAADQLREVLTHALAGESADDAPSVRQDSDLRPIQG